MRTSIRNLCLFGVWLAVAACGGDDAEETASATAPSGAAQSQIQSQNQSQSDADLPASLSIVDYNRLRDAIDDGEVPARIVPRLDPEERLSFSSLADAEEEFVDAIAEGDFERADRVFASVDSYDHNDLMNAGHDAAADSYSDGDYAESYRFDRYLNIDTRMLWMLEGDYISGRVTDKGTGEPVVGATVSADQHLEQSAQTSSNGEFRLLIPADSPTGLTIEHPDYDEQRIFQTESGSAISLAALQGEAVDIRLGTGMPRFTFRGRLVDASSGEPLAGVPVVAGFEPIETAPELNLQMVMGRFGRETDAEGRFEITDLPVETVQVVAQALIDGKLYQLPQEPLTFEDGVELLIELGPRTVELDLPMIVAGTVRDRTTGAPVANARVSAGGWKAENTDINGRFMIQLDTNRDWQLTASHQAYHESQPQAFASERPRTVEAEFLIDPITTGTILGTAINAATGEPIVNAVIQIAGVEVRTDSRGQFRAEEIESGEVTVNASQSGYRADSASLLLEALQTAEATLELEPITTGTVRGTVVEEGSGRALADVAVRAGDVIGTTDSSGAFTLEEVEAGAIVVAASKALFVPGSSDVSLEAMGSVDTRIELTPITWGTVRGSVTDASTGQPLRDATVRLGAIEVTTDADGGYIAERVPAGDVSLVAALARYHDAQDSVALSRDGDVEVSLALAPITTGNVQIVVIDASSGDPVGAATVMLGTRREETDASGRASAAEVPAGQVVANVTANLYEPGSAEAVLEAAGEAALEVRLIPITYGTVTGVAVNKTSGAPLANVRVRLADRNLQTDAEGRFRAERVPAGSVSITGELLRHYGDKQTVALDRGGEQTVELQLEPITTGTILGIVRDAASGEPIEGASVTVLGSSARTGADGRFEIEQVAAGAVSVRASYTLYEPGESSVELAAADTAETELLLTPITYGTISGTVVNAESGAPLANAAVSAGQTSARTDDEGRFSLERVPAGQLSVVASKAIFIDDSQSVALAAGESETMTLRLQPITWGTVTGTVIDAETGRPLSRAEVVVGTQAVLSDAAGRFVAERVAAGQLRISGRAPAYEATSVTAQLAPDTEHDVSLELQPIKIGSIEGRVVDAKTNEPIREARVTAGRFAAETDANGAFRFDDIGIGNVVVGARHPDYANGSASTEVPPADTATVVVRLDLRREDVTNLEAELAKTGSIDLYGIYFDSAKAEFKPSSLNTLRAVLEVMKRAPEQRFRIAGHTDSDGGDDYNQNLSERRANTVIRWLVDNGVDASRLDGAGFGETRPAAPNDTETGKALNRRVQLSFAE